MNILLLHPNQVNAKQCATLAPDQAVHVRTVLRAEPGDPIRIGLMNGPLGTGRVIQLDPEIRIDCTFEQQAPPRPCIDLLLALPRPKVMKRLWAPLATLGVNRIMLCNAEKVERNYFDTHTLQPNHYEPLLREGLQQAMDTQFPLVQIHRQLKVFLEDRLAEQHPNGDRLIAEPSATTSLYQRASQHLKSPLLLAVGPEGGWTPYEVELFARFGFEPVHAGPRILRTDTACTALLSMLNAALG